MTMLVSRQTAISLGAITLVLLGTNACSAPVESEDVAIGRGDR
jgi:hypothetical protein